MWHLWQNSLLAYEAQKAMKRFSKLLLRHCKQLRFRQGRRKPFRALGEIQFQRPLVA